MKRTIAVTLTIIILFAIAAIQPATAFAGTIGTVSPMYIGIVEIDVYLSVSGTVASYELSVEGISSTTKVSTVLQLQRLTSGAWNDYGSPWTATANSRYLFTNGTRSVASGYTYRLKVVVTAYTPSGNNSATAYS